MNDNLSVDNSAHDNFYSNYHSMGFPTLCRNIAISNGSECGSDQGFAPLTTIFSNTSSTSIPYVYDAASSWVQVIGGLFSNRPLIGLYAPLSIISTKSSFEIDFNAKALPDHGTDKIYNGTVGIKRKVLGLFNINANITNKNVYAQSYMLPLDSAPGGRADFSNASSLGIPSDFATLVQVGGFGYIPTVSALDIGSGNTTIGTPQLYSAYSINNPPTSPYNTSFSSFVTAVGNTNGGGNNNEDHVTFTPRNGSFLLKELQGNTNTPANCAVFCNTLTLIQGPAELCTSASYTISNLPTGTTLNWSLNPSSGVASLSTSGNTAILIPTGNGTVQLSVTVNSTCGSIIISKAIVIGTPAPTITSVKTSVTGEPTFYQFTASVIAGATYYWYVNGVLEQSNTDNTFGWYYPCNSSITIKCRISNTCGTSAYSNSITHTGECTRAGALVAYPNPANTTLTVQYLETDSTTNSNYISFNDKQVMLYNDKGKVMKEERLNATAKKVILDIRNIPNGTYYLHVKDEKETIKQQIIITH
ncbi:T9SS type A sorting domain-containing protein [Pelobium sp.]|nr:T9SS type A sorting domain-containing protein [Pelobium sp.]